MKVLVIALCIILMVGSIGICKDCYTEKEVKQIIEKSVEEGIKLGEMKAKLDKENKTTVALTKLVSIGFGVWGVVNFLGTWTIYPIVTGSLFLHAGLKKE